MRPKEGGGGSPNSTELCLVNKRRCAIGVLRRAGDEVPADDGVGTELAIVFSTQTQRSESCIPVAASAVGKIIGKGGGTIKRIALVKLSGADEAVRKAQRLIFEVLGTLAAAPVRGGVGTLRQDSCLHAEVLAGGGLSMGGLALWPSLCKVIQGARNSTKYP